ncbi:hypothetical protein GCM10028798_00540 [Humibacter antri]
MRPWGPDVTQLHIIEVLVDTESGVIGHGFSWTPTIGAHAVRAMLDHDIRDFVLGRHADARTLWTPLWQHLHEAGSGGVTTIAMAGLDLALWDAAGRAAQASVTQLLGARRTAVGVYGSGVNRHYPLEEMVAQAGRWRDAGYRLVKMKVGGHALAEDVDRVAAVRETIGPDVGLAIDANQLWGLDEAEHAIDELSSFGLRWVEEPLRADDLLGHAALRSRIDVPVALGENLHTTYRFREAIELGAADILQPNVIRVGGITPFLAIAELVADTEGAGLGAAGAGGSAGAGARVGVGAWAGADASARAGAGADASARAGAGVEVHPHLLPELSGQLALALNRTTLVEDVEDAGFERLGLLAEPAPVRIANAALTSTGRPGLGITLA